MAVIRCDRCAARLTPQQGTCHKCGETNSDYSGAKGERNKRGGGVGALVPALVLMALLGAALRFVPSELVAGLPVAADVMGVRAAVFKDSVAVPDAIGRYMKAWGDGDVLSMLEARKPGDKAVSNDSRYVMYPVRLFSYDIVKVMIDGDKAFALVTSEVSDTRDAIRSVGSMRGTEPNIVGPAIRAALKGAEPMRVTGTVKLLKTGGSWKILEGLDPSADEFLAPVRKLRLNGEELPEPPDSWDQVTTRSVSCGRDKLGAISLSGIVENPSPDDLGPYEVEVTFFGSDGTQVGQASALGTGLRKESYVPFSCGFLEKGAGVVEKYTIAVKSLY